MTSRKRLAVSLVILSSVFWIGVIGYMVIGGLAGADASLLDAVYMVAITLSTVGLTEVFPRTPAVQVWTVVIVFFGVTSAAVAIGSLTGLIVEGEIGRLIGSRKLESRIKHLNNHVIICGFGRMGKLLVQRLIERGVPLVVVERDPQKCRRIEQLGQLYLVGDATEEDTLHRAGIGRAKHLVALLTSDGDNVFVTLTARQMRPELHIVARAEQLSSEAKILRAGADRVISTQAIGAERIANVLTRPQLVDLVDVASKSVELEVDEFVVSNDSPIAGKSLRESNIRQAADVMVVAIRGEDGSTRFNPGANEIVQPNDTLITIGPTGAVSCLEKMKISRGEATG